MSNDQPSVLDKRRTIAEHVAGKSFVDVGGLWGTKGEMVTSAAKGGASSLTMADVQEPDNEWWVAFRKHCADLGVTGCDEVHVNIIDPNAPRDLARSWDFVHCSGLMYHVPDLFGFVSNLVSISNEYLLLSSVTMPDRIDNAAGVLEFAPDEALLTPLLSAEHQAILRTYLEEQGLRALGLTHDGDFIVDGVPKTGPWWWLFSGAFLSRFLTMYGLDVVAEGQSPNGQAYSVLARIPQRTV